MSAEPPQRKLVTIKPKPPGEITRPIWPPTERAKQALRELQEGKLLVLTLDRGEDEIDFMNSYKNVDPDSVASYFDSLSPFIFSLYHYPGTETVVLIWTRHEGSISIKHIQAQNGVRMDVIAIAEQEGIKIAKTIKVQKQEEASGDRLREEIFSPPSEGTV